MFYVTVNGIVFLVLNLYPVTLLNSFTSSSHFCCRSLRIFNMEDCPQIKTSFPSICLLFWLPSICYWIWNFMEHSKSRDEVPREVSVKACQLEQGWQKETRSPTVECNEFGLTYSLCKILGWRNCHKKGMSNLMEGTSFFVC